MTSVLRFAVQAKKRGSFVRILLMLIDGNKHVVNDFYDWVAESYDPRMAVSQFKKRNIQLGDSWPLEDQIAEGRRIKVHNALFNMEKDGFITVVWPNREAPRFSKSHGHIDPRKCVIQLTEGGMKHVLESHGIFVKMMSELHGGIRNSRLKMSVGYLGNPNIELQEALTESTEMPISEVIETS